MKVEFFLIFLFTVKAGKSESLCKKGVKIENPNEIDKIKGCEKLEGDLTIKNTGIEKIEFDELREVDGTIIVYGVESLTSISFPKLNKTMGLNIGHNIKLKQINFPELLNSKKIKVFNNEKLNFINMNKLRDTDSFELLNSQIKSLELSDMRTVGLLNIYSNPELIGISLPLLKECKNETNISENDILEDINIPKLVTIGGEMNIDSNPKLKSLESFLSLANIEGDLIVNGDIETFSLKKIAKIYGKCQLNGSKSFNCEAFKSEIFKLANVNCECGDKMATSSTTKNPNELNYKKLDYDGTEELKNNAINEKTKNDEPTKIPGKSENTHNYGKINSEVKSSSSKCELTRSGENVLKIYLIFLFQVFVVYYLSCQVNFDS
ncbi:Cell wall protein ecm33 [Smittium mucronatum]|uniref:Cell wall protein ecm33 n=1 Tax=Smittium mucronatum TaxID=133383 RepID=A0A1R0GN89_9FUNG|nr:Cell wall protein ecm33 [Smittium mucronatum]